MILGGPEEYRESLKTIIRKRTLFITGDCDTFLHVKRQVAPLIAGRGSGGGNFLMAIGLFALLNFLAKVYAQLVNPTAFWDAGYKAQLNESKRRIIGILNKHSDAAFRARDKQYVRDHFYVRPGAARDEKTLFTNLVAAAQRDLIDFGIPNTETAGALRDVFRNALTHMAMTRQASVAAYDSIHGLTIADARSHVLRGKSAFFQDDKGVWVCNTDGLNLTVRAVAEWLCIQVDRSDDRSAERTMAWIREQQGITQGTLPVAEE